MIRFPSQFAPLAGGGHINVRELREVTSDTPLRHIFGNVYVKDETRNPARCFKLRSMARLIDTLSPLHRVFVTASSGNTGLALSVAAAACTDARAEVWMEASSSDGKREAVRRSGGVVHVIDGSFSEVATQAQDAAARLGGYFISPGVRGPFTDGHGAIAREIDRQLVGSKTILVPTGGGGLLAACIDEIQASSSKHIVSIVGVQAEDSSPVYDLFHNKSRADKAYRADYAECFPGSSKSRQGS